MKVYWLSDYDNRLWLEPATKARGTNEPTEVPDEFYSRWKAAREALDAIEKEWEQVVLVHYTV